ncbi:MAG: CDP-diacylglycerol--serine O-phosphatidyltransferase [Alphaproteobacteria bacterium]|nr:CDP-diacylglycerol--serine O-phosphatidyltransferase [Alphaproteobacteria bacterium]
MPETIGRMKDMPLTRLLPNMLTLLALCSGLTAMRFALLGKWQEAVVAIVLAAVFDVLDGRVARLLNIASKFGAELDSLSDVICFGVAPGFMLYLWEFQHEETGLGWIAVLVFAVCTALRLARFNTMLEDHTLPAWTKSFFTGVPAPAGAGIALLPLMLFLRFGEAVQPPSFVLAIWLIIVGGLMVSRLPTLSMKGRRVAPVWVAPIMAGSALFVAALVTNPWLTLAGAATLYVLLLPYGWYSYRKKQLQEEQEKEYDQTS